MDRKRPQLFSYKPSSKRNREEILNAETKEDVQVVALALEMQLQTHRRIFRELGFWAPHVIEITELYPLARQVLRDLREPSPRREQ